MTEDYIKETVEKAVDEAVDKAVDKAVDEKIQNVLADNPVPASNQTSEDNEMELLDDDGFGNLDFDEDEMMDEDAFIEVDEFDTAGDDFDFDSVDEIISESGDDETKEASEDSSTEEGSEAESPVEESSLEEVPVEDVPAEEIETIPEIEVLQESEDNTLIRSVESADYMLDKIQKILNDTDLQAVSADKIELFKTLRTLLDYLPEGEKNNSITRRMNMILAYLIDKLSGRPGLLATSESLIKSGVLGDEYFKNLVYEKSGEITNSLISKVLTDMKKLSDSLSDREIAKALCASADGILEQIELEDQKSRIF